MGKFMRFWKHTSAKIGLGMYAAIWLFTIIGSLLLPMDPYEYDSLLANLPPAHSYLSIPDVDTQKIANIVNGTTYGMAVMKDGTFKAWGDLPFSIEDIDTPIDKIASGAQHIVYTDKENRIFEIGDVSSSFSKLRMEEQEAIQKDGIQEVYASDNFSACLSKTGYLYVWGSKNAFDLPVVPAAHQGHIVKAAISPYHLLYMLDDGTLNIAGREDRLSDIPIEVRNGGMTICHSAINSDNVLIIDDHQNIYTWGDTAYDVKINQNVIKVISGRHTFHLLMEDGTVVGLGPKSISEKNIQDVFSNYYQLYAIRDGTIKTSGHQGFLLGSDAYGRDIAARLAHGGFATLLIGVPTCIVSLLLSVFFGLTSGYFGGKYDHAVMRFSDCISSIPFLPIVITLSAFLIGNVDNYSRIAIVMLLYGCVSWTSLARLIRAKVMAEKEKDYILYEQTISASSCRILCKHIFPSTFPLIAADITSLYASTLLMEASLSFLGLGIPPIMPSWGNMLQAAQSIHVIEYYWWQWFFPSLCIFLSILSVHLIAEVIRKQFDPKE